MSRTKLMAAAVLAAFVSLNVYTLLRGDLAAFLSLLRSGDPWILLLSADLVIALGMVVTWMWDDAKRRSTSALPYTLVTLLTGSIGPLCYLLTRREVADRA